VPVQLIFNSSHLEAFMCREAQKNCNSVGNKRR